MTFGETLIIKLLFSTTVSSDEHICSLARSSYVWSNGSQYFADVSKDQLGAKCCQMSAATAFVHLCQMNRFPFILRLHLSSCLPCLPLSPLLLCDLQPVFTAKPNAMNRPLMRRCVIIAPAHPTPPKKIMDFDKTWQWLLWVWSHESAATLRWKSIENPQFDSFDDSPLLISFRILN